MLKLSVGLVLSISLLSSCVHLTQNDNTVDSAHALKKSFHPYSNEHSHISVTHNTLMDNSCPQNLSCSELVFPCIRCSYNTKCTYGEVTKVSCSVADAVPCAGEKTFEKEYVCQYCYQTEPWQHSCVKKASCSSVSSPQSYYKTNCTVHSNVLCLGSRRFLKNVRCNWTGGYRWSTALILSITMGGFGADRFYLGHWQEGIGKVFSFGGLGVWTIIDIILIAIRYLGPADGSLYL